MTTDSRARIALVTGGGAAEGIGFATCRRLAASGYGVAVTDVDTDAARAAAAGLVADGADAIGLEGDVSSPDSIRRMMAAVVEHFGRLDVLVNNAGMIYRCEPQELADDALATVLGVNLQGAFRCAREAFPLLREGDAPAIVNVSSTTARLGTMDSTAYAASKAGLEGLTRSLAVSWARFGVRVNAVAPGPVMTTMVRRQLERGIIDEARIAGWSARVPLGRFAEPGEIAEVIGFLASPAASFVTGVTLRADGGLAVNGT